MANTDEKVGIFFGILFMVLVAVAVGLFPAYVIVDIANIFDIPLLQDLTFKQVYACILIFGIVTHKHKKAKEDPSEKGEFFAKAIGNILGTVVGISLVWGVAILANMLL